MEYDKTKGIDLSEIKLIQDESGFHFELLDGTITRNFYWATAFSNYFGHLFAMVQKEYSSPFQAMNIEGKLSDRGFPNTTTLFRFIEQGGNLTYSYSVEKQKKNDMPNHVKQSEWTLCQDEFHGENNFKPYCFKNSKGEILAGKRFAYAEPFSDGFALVQEDKNGWVCFIDEQGRMSESYSHAMSYKCGFAQVLKYSDGVAYNHYRDTNGNLSEPFCTTYGYENEYGIVVTKFGSWARIRNSHGELSDELFSVVDAMRIIKTGEAKDLKFISRKETTQQPKENAKSLERYSMQSATPNAKSVFNLNKYFAYELSIYDLTPEEILDNLEKIQQFEEMNYKMAIEQCKYKQSMETIYQDYMAIAEYIKQTAYEASKKRASIAIEEKNRDDYQEKPLF